MRRMRMPIAFATAVCSRRRSPSAQTASDAPKILSVDHKVTVKSIVPAIAGQPAQIYVRERVAEGLKSPAADRVVLFVHGAGTPAEVAFDVPTGDYSWMAYLAKAGFDVFSMDTTGYGRSTRPAPMNDPCNLSDEQQKQFVPTLIPAPCKATYPGQLTTIASDWNDIDAVVDHIRKLRSVQKVSMVAWSLGGPRAGGYAAQHPDKVHRLVLLAPAYNRDAAAEAPAVAETRHRVQHAVAQRVRRELGSPGRLREPVRSESARSGVGGDDRVRSGRREVGHRRPPRAVDDDLGIQQGDGQRHEDPDADDRGRARQAGAARTRARRSTTTSASTDKVLDRSRLRVAQRDVGEATT